MTDTFWALGVAAALFFAVHLSPNVPGLRSRLIAALGVQAYRGLFSLIAAGSLVWMVMAYVGAPYVELWFAPSWVRFVPIGAMPFSIVLLVLTYASPGAVKTITRHPMLWAVALWAIAHIPPNGDIASMVLFGGFAAYAVLAMVLADRRLQREDPTRWSTAAAETSLIPFAAAASGRAQLSLAALGWWKVALGLALYVVVLFAHQHVIGISAAP